jgi:hypothetical protein
VSLPDCEGGGSCQCGLGPSPRGAASDQDRATLEGEPLATPAEYADSCSGERPRQYPGSLIGRETEHRETEQRFDRIRLTVIGGLTLHAGLHFGALRRSNRGLLSMTAVVPSVYVYRTPGWGAWSKKLPALGASGRSAILFMTSQPFAALSEPARM